MLLKLSLLLEVFFKENAEICVALPVSHYSRFRRYGISKK